MFIIRKDYEILLIDCQGLDSSDLSKQDVIVETLAMNFSSMCFFNTNEFPGNNDCELLQVNLYYFISIQFSKLFYFLY